MTIDETGFFSKDIDWWIQKHRDDYNEVFQLCEDLNKFCHRVAMNVDTHVNDAREVVISCLFSRALTAFQAIIILSERGMRPMAQVILRTLLEALFRIGAINNDKEIAIEYIRQDLLRQKKLSNKCKMLSPDLKAVIGEIDLDQWIDKIDNKFGKNKIKELSSYKFADKAGLLDAYNTEYSLLCDQVHLNVRDIDKLLMVDQNQEITSINYGPDVNNIYVELLSAAEHIIEIVDIIMKLFDVTVEDDLDHYTGRLKILMRNEWK